MSPTSLCLTGNDSLLQTSLHLGECSALNHMFWEIFTSHIKTLAPTEVSLSSPSHLIQRLRNSQKLQDLFNLVDFVSSAESVEWMCCALDHGSTVTIFCLPERFYSLNKDSPYLLPLILVQCHQAQILSTNPDLPATNMDADTFIQFDLRLETPRDMTKLDTNTADILSKLHSFHTRLYLHLVHSALINNLPISPQDFHVGLELCQHCTLLVDITPLISALCSHSKTSLSSGSEVGVVTPPLPSHILSQLLSNALSKFQWTLSLHLAAMEETMDKSGSCCSQMSLDINQSFLRHLEGVGFRAVVASGLSCYWLNKDPALKSEESDWVSDHVVSLSILIAAMHRSKITLTLSCHLPPRDWSILRRRRRRRKKKRKRRRIVLE